MKMLKDRWSRIPKWVRVLLNLTAAAVLVLTIYILLDAPALTDQQAFRRTEKANLVGPGEIVTELELDQFAYEKLIVAETDRGVEFYAYDGRFQSNRFSYQRKNGNLTVAVPPGDIVPLSWSVFGKSRMPVFLFHEFPEAVRAELELSLIGSCAWNDGTDRTMEFEEHPLLRSVDMGDGWFRFAMEVEGTLDFTPTPSLEAAELLIRVCDPYVFNPDRKTEIPVTIRLYDEADRLIHEEQQILRSIDR